MIEQIELLAKPLALLHYDRLQHQANAILGRPIRIHQYDLRLLWASLSVHAKPDDIESLLDAQRKRFAARQADQETRIRIERIATFRDALREDPTLALAQMLLD